MLVAFLFKTWFPSSVSVTCAQILGMQKQPKYVMITASPSHLQVTAHLHSTCALNVLMKFTVNIPIRCFLIFCILCSRCPWLVKTRLVCCYIWYSFLVMPLDERCTHTHTHTHTYAHLAKKAAMDDIGELVYNKIPRETIITEGKENEWT